MHSTGGYEFDILGDPQCPQKNRGKAMYSSREGTHSFLPHLWKRGLSSYSSSLLMYIGSWSNSWWPTNHDGTTKTRENNRTVNSWKYRNWKSSYRSCPVRISNRETSRLSSDISRSVSLSRLTVLFIWVVSFKTNEPPVTFAPFSSGCSRTVSCSTSSGLGSQDYPPRNNMSISSSKIPIQISEKCG